MQIIDTHCHLDVSEFDSDRDVVIQRCSNSGISKIIVPAIERNNFEDVISLCQRYPGMLYPALGLHPVYIEKHVEDDLYELDKAIQENNPVAVGEIGLDFYIKETDRNKQVEYLEAQLALAEKYGLPVLLHIRKAYDDILKSLDKFNLPGGIAHAFNGSIQHAGKLSEMGFKLGFGGMLTYEHSSKLRSLAKQIPLESIVLETDAPDMTVASHHGSRNSPEYLTDVLAALAEVKQLEPELVAKQTTLNAIELLQIH